MSSHTKSLVFVAAMLAVATTFVSADWVLPKKGTVNLDGFLVVACAQTWYPDTCYNSLSPYVSTTEKEPGRLALIALGQAVKETQEFVTRVPTLSVSGDAMVAVNGLLKSLVENGVKVSASLAKLQKVVGAQPGTGFDDTMVDIETQTRAAVVSVVSWTDKIKAADDGELGQAVESLKCRITNAWNLVVFFFNDETSPTFS